MFLILSTIMIITNLSSVSAALTASNTNEQKELRCRKTESRSLTEIEIDVKEVLKVLWEQIEYDSQDNICLKNILLKIKLRTKAINDNLINDWKKEITEKMGTIDDSLYQQIFSDLLNFGRDYHQLYIEYMKLFLLFYFHTENLNFKLKNEELYYNMSSEFKEYKGLIRALYLIEPLKLDYQNKNYQRWLEHFIDFLINVKIFIEGI